MTDLDLELVRTCLRSAEINMDAFLKETRRKNLTQAQTVLNLLSHQKFQMNPMGLVRQESTWLERIQAAIDEGRAVEIVYPQFCVIPNAPKRYTNMGTSAGEDCTIEFFKLIDRHVRKIHEPGVRFIAIADAALYGSAFNTHQTEADAYYAAVEQRISDLDAQHCVSLYDYAELMRTRCHPDYQVAYYEIGHQVWKGDYKELLPDTDLETLRKSVRCSVNTRRLQLSHDDHRRLFGPLEWREVDHPFHDLIETMTDIAFKELITIRLSCGAIDIATRLWPGALRATCHKGPKNGRWALGLKPYPEYYGSCKLLPYHGMPIISHSKKGAPRLEIEPEVLLRSRDDLIRVTLGSSDEVYAYVHEDVDGGIHSAGYERFQGMRVGENYPPKAYIVQ
jgi:hypothetical protein